MGRVAKINIGAALVGFALVFLLPSAWLGPIDAVAAIAGFICAIGARIDTKTEPPENPVAEAALSVLNLPEQPLAKVPEAWPLHSFLALSCFLVGLGIAVMVRANA